MMLSCSNLIEMLFSEQSQIGTITTTTLQVPVVVVPICSFQALFSFVLVSGANRKKVILCIK